MKWFIGQKIVCIDDMSNGDKSVIRPEKDVVYTIRDIFDLKRQDKQLTFLLREIVNDKRLYKDYEEGIGEKCWLESHFRPVKETDIEVFNKILQNINNQKKFVFEYDSGL